MNCACCGRPAKRLYQWNGQGLGSSCYRALNPYYTDPAQAVFLAATGLLAGDRAPVLLLPVAFRVALTASLRRQIDNEASVFGGSEAYRLALWMRNTAARRLYPAKVFQPSDLLRFEEGR